MAPPKKYPRSVRAKDALRVLARAYASANLRRPKEYYDDSLAIDMGPLDNYLVLKQVGRGKYGEVFEVSEWPPMHASCMAMEHACELTQVIGWERPSTPA